MTRTPRGLLASITSPIGGPDRAAVYTRIFAAMNIVCFACMSRADHLNPAVYVALSFALVGGAFSPPVIEARP